MGGCECRGWILRKIWGRVTPFPAPRKFKNIFRHFQNFEIVRGGTRAPGNSMGIQWEIVRKNNFSEVEKIEIFYRIFGDQ